MKIVLVNYRYFVSGGPERYYFNVKELLERHGHEVIPFSVKSARNLPNDYERYFLDIVDDEIYFAQAKKKTPRMVLKSFTRMFYSWEARRKFRRLLRDTRPDLVYIIQYHNKISPSVIDAARECHVPVVHRISDFQYMCPNALFYNDRKGICEDCLEGRRFSCVKYRCVLGSPVYSGIKMLAKMLHDAMRVTERVDAFVVPSAFTMGKLARYGIPSERLHHIPTFFNQREAEPQVTYEPFVLFVGRIERQKGLMTLVRAFEDLPYALKIIGFSNDGYEETLKQYLGSPAGTGHDGAASQTYGRRGNIQFLGRMDFDGIVPYLKSCLCTVVPSEWYDNFPNVILESFAYKKAVVATDIGSLPELVRDGATGLTFRYADAADLGAKVSYLFAHPDEARAMGERAYAAIEENYTPEKHYAQLMPLFRQIIKKP